MEIFGYTFGKLDIIIIVLVLLFALAGLAKGFLKQILSVANSLVSVIVSYLLVNPVTELISKTAIADKVNGKVLDIIVSKFPDAASVPISMIDSKETLANAFTEAGLPAFASKYAADFIDLENVAEGSTLADSVAHSIGFLVLSILVFVVLFILILIIIKVIIKILDSFVEEGILNVVNKLLGLLLGVAKGAILVCVALLILSILSQYVTEISDFVNNDLQLATDHVGIARYLYENNPLISIANALLGKQ